MVYSKSPFGGLEQVLRYLARDTHRVALSNRRLVRLEADQVTFTYKDYRQESQARGIVPLPLRPNGPPFL
jgi:hypothetical protein